MKSTDSSDTMPRAATTDLSPSEKLDLHPVFTHWRSFIMSRAVLIVVMALFTLSFAPQSYADGGEEGDGVVWGS